MCLPHHPGVVYYHLLLRREPELPPTLSCRNLINAALLTCFQKVCPAVIEAMKHETHRDEKEPVVKQ